MPTFVTHNLTPELIQTAKNYFLTQGRSDFLQKPPQSICSRYLIAQKIKSIPEDNTFKHGDLRYSASHSGNLIVIAFDTKKIAIDIEKIKSKPTEYYHERTAKEALIKYLNLPLDEHENIQVNAYKGTTCTLEYKKTTFQAKTFVKQGYVRAILN